MTTIDRYVQQVEGTVIPVPGEDIDTDRIIPARFMKGITFEGLGEYAFFDERFDEQGTSRSHPFNDARFTGGSILLVESNFGCGSSREHAPQALQRFGIKALIGISFADIFAGNCTQLGIAAVRVTREDHSSITAKVMENSGVACTIDLVNRVITVDTAEFPLFVDDAACKALVLGLWDTTALLYENRQLIQDKAKELPYLCW